MKLIAISDIHNHYPIEMPKADILTVSGDLCFAARHDFHGQKHHVENFIRWCEMLLEDKIYSNIVWIAGNHDIILEHIMLKNEEDDFRKTLPKGITYLRDSLIEINGIKIYGTPFSPPFCDWGYNRPEGELDDIFAKIPEGIDILLSHSPAFGLNDKITEKYRNQNKLGSKALLKHVKRVRPSYLLVGHIHSGNHNVVEIVQENQVIKCVNVSLLNENYEIQYKPYEFEINKEKI